MMDYRFGMFYNQTFDPQARNLGELGNWKERSRDPESKHSITALISTFLLTKKYSLLKLRNTIPMGL